MTAVTIVHITTVPQTLGFLRSQMRYMKQQGFSVQAVASAGEAGELISSEDEIQFRSVEMSREITPLRDLWSLWKLSCLLRDIKPTIVHAHTPKAGLLGMLAATFCMIPVKVFHLHGAPHLAAHGVRRTLLWLTTRISCTLANRVLCVSPSNQEVLVSDGSCSKSKIYIPGNGSCGGIDTAVAFNPQRFDRCHRKILMDRLRIPEGAFIAAFIGRIVRDKGIVDLAEAWTVLKKKYPSMHLIVAGTTEAHDPIPAEAAKVLMEDGRVHLTGWVSDVPSLLASVDLLVHPSYREGFGNVCLEASAMCLPVVSTRVPGCVDAVLDGTTGLLVPPRTPGALADAIARYIDDPALRAAHGKAGRLRAANDYQTGPILLDIHDQYRQLLAGRGLPCPHSPE